MPGKLETYLIDAIRNKPLKKFFKGKQGRKVLSKALPDDVIAVTVQTVDHKIMVDPRDLVGRSVLLHGNWGREGTSGVVEYLTRIGKLHGQGVALNLGANIGCQALYLKLTDQFDKVIAVEAAPQNFEFLRTNIHLNDWANEITPIHAAVYTEDGTIELHLKEDDVSGGHSLLNLPGNTRSVTVTALTVGSIVQREKVAPDDVKFVWMDIEGFDFDILQDINQTFGNRLPVFFEFSPRFIGEEKAREFIAYLRENYTNILDFNNSGAGSGPVTDFDALAKTPQQDLLVFSD
ncbi:FkbM family methyltransferase [Sneathiella sp. HT1-7]|uniref:FkbM family methyltransferase n=1 Tax=Sneathiella sp. HT1-7 TaxID=2887192 RepID=UPI001D138A8E|nr:FkbM family methyltransferase [Sneathiella sp. HT1-7]MCC3305566.1 FkbM family methyltransferase [Sneathiella sp. HT1-7]